MCSIFCANVLVAQKNEKRIKANEFNEQQAYEIATQKGIPKKELKGYIQTLKQNFYSERSLKKQNHVFTPYENNIPEQERFINYGQNKLLSIGCPNAGFEQYNFINWSGSNGTYSGTASSPTYSLNNGIINSAGANTALANTTNFHTIMSQPATNAIYPNCVGYDSLGARNIGGQIVSEIPFISPYSLDGVSCRMLGAYGDFKVSKLKYNMSVTSNNKLFRYSYAIVLNDGHTGDITTHQPYFKVTVKDQNGNPITGCNNYFKDATQALTDTSFKKSHLQFGGNDIVYKKWSLVSIDLSSPTYSLVTGISIEFEVAGCSAGGHLGYAYVDAECGMGGINRSYCVGPNAILKAPLGFEQYQWYDNNNIAIPPPAGTNYSINISSASLGQVYSVNMLTAGGCTITLRDTLRPTNVSISYLNSAPSCGGGNSGLAYVEAAGSTGTYNYTWTSTSGSTAGQNVSFSQTATNLPPGTYSVVVNSQGCGQAEANLSVGVTPPAFFTVNKVFCGTTAVLDKPGGSSYKWYQGSGSSATLIPPPQGNNDSLFVNNATTGMIYSLVYTNTQGCKDSIKYILNQVAGGSAYVSNIKNVCPGSTDGAAVIHLNTSSAANYTFLVTNSSGSTINNVVTASLTLTITSLPAGTYYAKVYDGQCYYYDNVFKIEPIQTNFTATSTDSMLCFPVQNATVSIQYADTLSSCATNTHVCYSGTETVLFSSGTFTTNNEFKYPTPYGNYYTKERSQFLIRQSDLNSAGVFKGKLSSLAFNVLNLNNGELFYPNFSIKIGCTDKTELANASAANQPFETGLTAVYYHPKQQITSGWVTHVFATPYYWDGVSNLIVEVCFEFPGTFNFSENISVELKQMPYIANMYYIEDVNPVCSGSQQADNGNGVGEIPMANGINMLPNMTFGYCPYTNSPSEYTLSVSSNGNLTHNFNNDSLVIAPTFTAPPFPTNSTVYTITAVNPNGGCINSNTVSVIYPANNMSITATTSTNSVCENSPITLSSFGAITYTWESVQSTGSTVVSNSSSVTLIPTSVGENTFVVTGASNCANTIPDTKTVTVVVLQTADLMINGLVNSTKCINKDLVLESVVSSTTIGNPGQPYTYLWTTLPSNDPAPGNNTSSIYTVTANNPTTFVISVNGYCAYPNKDTVVINTFTDDLSVEIIDSASICQNTPFTLNAIATGGRPNYSFSWFLYPNTINPISASNTLNYSAPEQEGNHLIYMTVIDSCGYSKTDEQLINVLPPCNVIIPNVITPNGDGINDFFKIRNLEHHPNINITIYDRWGIKIYEKTNYQNDWNAEGLSDGTFFYIIEVPDDKNYSGYFSVFRN